MEITGNATFWVFFAVFWYCDHKQYMAGHDTWLFTHKTEAEKKIRDRLANGD